MKGMNDYRSRDRAAADNLKKHEERMGALIMEGKTREEASRIAYQEMTAKRAGRTRAKFGEEIEK